MPYQHHEQDTALEPRTAPREEPAPATFSPAAAASVRAFARGGQPTPAQVVALQGAVGNQALARMLQPAGAAGVAREPVAQAPAAQTPTGPTPADPSSGIDWMAFFQGDGPALIRGFLEVTRIVPAFGLITGGASDILNAVQDFAAIEAHAPPEFEAFLAGRHTLAILNNGLGHAVYVTSLVQDIATASVVGAEFDAITVPLNVTLLTCKAIVGSFQQMVDITVMVMSEYMTNKAPLGSDARKAWEGMLNNYEANVVGGIAGGILDVIDLATVGFANAQPVKQGVNAMSAIINTAWLAWDQITTILSGWFNIWGGGIVGGLGGGQRIADAIAGQLMLAELEKMKGAYLLGDAMIGAAADHVASQIAELEQGARMVLGGRDPFIAARDAAVGGLEQLEQQIAGLGQLRVMTSTAAEKSAAIDGYCAEQLALLDSLVVPDVDLPEADLGEGAAADLAEDLLDFAGGAAEAGIGALLGQLTTEVERLKTMLRAPIEEIRENSAAFGEFMQMLTDEAGEQIAEAEARTAGVREKLARCTCYENVIDVIVGEIFEMAGLHGDFKVDDVRRAWAEVGVMIDDAIVWAIALRDGEPVPAPDVAEPDGRATEAAAAPDPGRSDPRAAAAASAAASPPPAPPSGEAAGRDLTRPAAPSG